MASLADLGTVFSPTNPAGFTLAGLDVAGSIGQAQAGVQRDRILRNFGQFDLPDLLTSQGARGAYFTSATENKRTRLTTGAQDQLTDVQLGLAQQQAQLAANGLLAQTGISLGSYA